MPPLVANHLDRAWADLQKTATRLGIPVTQLSDKIHVAGEYANLTEVQRNNIQKRANATGGVSLSRMPPAAFNPFLSITTLQIPTELRALNALRRFYYVHDPFVRTSLDLHTRYPISDFRIRCEDPSIQEEYEEVMEDNDMMQLLLWIGSEYWIVGEAIPFGHWNKDELCWDSFVLMNPDFVDIVHPVLGEGRGPGHRPEIYLSNYTKELKAIISRGPDDPKTGRLYKRLNSSVPDLVDKIKNNQPFRLADMAVSHLANRQYFAARGFSLTDSILRVLMYEERMYEGQIRGVERYQNPIELWKLGDTEDPADDQLYDKFEAVLQTTWLSPVKAIVWNHAIENEMIGAAPAMLPLGPEFEHTEQLKMTGLMVDASLLHGEGPTYANASVASDYRIGFYQTYRTQLEKWMSRNFFEPIATARGYYKPVKRQLAGRYRVKSQKRRPILPEYLWARGLKTDTFGTLGTVVPLAQEGKAPWKRVYQLLDWDPKEVMQELQEEAIAFAPIVALQAKANAAAQMESGGAPIGGSGLPPALGGDGSAPLDDEGLTNTGGDMITNIDNSGAPNVMPPESSQPTPTAISNNGVAMS